MSGTKVMYFAKGWLGSDGSGVLAVGEDMEHQTFVKPDWDPARGGGEGSELSSSVPVGVVTTGSPDVVYFPTLRLPSWREMSPPEAKLPTTMTFRPTKSCGRA